MSYLERLRNGEFSQTKQPNQLTKPSKPPFVPFVSTSSRTFSEIPTHSSKKVTFVWDAIVDGKRVTIIDPERLTQEQMNLVTCSKFGGDRVNDLKRRNIGNGGDRNREMSKEDTSRSRNEDD